MSLEKRSQPDVDHEALEQARGSHNTPRRLLTSRRIKFIFLMLTMLLCETVFLATELSLPHAACPMAAKSTNETLSQQAVSGPENIRFKVIDNGDVENDDDEITRSTRRIINHIMKSSGNAISPRFRVEKRAEPVQTGSDNNDTSSSTASSQSFASSSSLWPSSVSFSASESSEQSSFSSSQSEHSSSSWSSISLSVSSESSTQSSDSASRSSTWSYSYTYSQQDWTQQSSTVPQTSSSEESTSYEEPTSSTEEPTTSSTTSSSTSSTTTTSSSSSSSSSTHTTSTAFSSSSGSYVIVGYTTVVSSATVIAVTTMTTTPTASVSSSSKNNTSASKTKKVAVGCAVGIGVPIIAVLAVVFFIWRRRKAESSTKNYVDSNGRDVGIAIDDDSFLNKLKFWKSSNSGHDFNDALDDDMSLGASASSDTPDSPDTGRTFVVDRPKPIKNELDYF